MLLGIREKTPKEAAYKQAQAPAYFAAPKVQRMRYLNCQLRALKARRFTLALVLGSVLRRRASSPG